jgi:hypothetical protein
MLYLIILILIISFCNINCNSQYNIETPISINIKSNNDKSIAFQVELIINNDSNEAIDILNIWNSNSSINSFKTKFLKIKLQEYNYILSDKDLYPFETISPLTVSKDGKFRFQFQLNYNIKGGTILKEIEYEKRIWLRLECDNNSINIQNSFVFQPKFPKILLIVHFNNFISLKSSEDFIEINKGFFPNMVLLNYNKLSSGLNTSIGRFNQLNTGKGWHMARGLIWAIREHPGYDGYMLVNDDVVLNYHKFVSKDFTKVWRNKKSQISKFIIILYLFNIIYNYYIYIYLNIL